jgi:hypothetical protein
MSDYLKSTNFATKDSLPSGNAGKIVKGTEIDNEFNAIADAVESKADLLNPVFSGLLTTDTLTTGGAANVGGTLAVAGTLSAAEDIQFTGTGRVKVPSGTTAQRPASPSVGSLRFNTTLGFLENYNGTEWRLVSPDPTPAQVSDQLNTSTGYFQVPKGTDAQRPVTPMNGLIRYNSTQGFYECYVGTAWHRFVTVNQGAYTLYYVLVGGGAGVQGAGAARGGGGAGQVLENSVPTNIGTSFTITVAAGGAPGSAGGTTTLSGVTSAVGGGSTTGGSGGTSGNGYGGGGPFMGEGGVQTSGGGGGAGQAGGNGTEGLGGTGGNGVATNITGTSTYHGGGGAGGGQFGASSAGLGGGGAAATAGSANTGGGGGGTYGSQTSSGGSGKVVIKMLTDYYSGTYTGTPTISTIGSYTCLTYTSSGTYTA